MPLTVEHTRKLARVVTVDDVLVHTNADRLEIALVGGWQCVVAKDELVKGQKAFYFEIDSALPVSHPLFGFLNGRTNDLRKSEDETVYCQIRSIKLRGEISQGLLIAIPEGYEDAEHDPNLTQTLGVLKWTKNQEDVLVEKVKKYHWTEKVAMFIRGKEEPSVYMDWPGEVPKTDQERIQNLPALHRQAVENEETFEKSVKLNGQSASFLVDNHKVRIMNRNNELRQDKVNYSFVYSLRLWLAAFFIRIYKLITTGYFSFPSWKTCMEPAKDKVVNFAKSGFNNNLLSAHYFRAESLPIVFQGELIGPGINGNYERRPDYEFYVFDVFMKIGGDWTKLLPEDARAITNSYLLKYVPVLETHGKLPADMKKIIEGAEGKSEFDPKVKREGLVYKSNSRDFSFKVISNTFLLKEAKEEQEEQNGD